MSVGPGAPDVPLVTAAHFDQPQQNIFNIFKFFSSVLVTWGIGGGCRARSFSAVLVKHHNGG